MGRTREAARDAINLLMGGQFVATSEAVLMEDNGPGCTVNGKEGLHPVTPATSLALTCCSYDDVPELISPRISHTIDSVNLYSDIEVEVGCRWEWTGHNVSSPSENLGEILLRASGTERGRG